MFNVPPNDHGSAFKIALEDLPIGTEPLLQESTSLCNATALCAAEVLSLAALWLIAGSNAAVLISPRPPALDDCFGRHQKAALFGDRLRCLFVEFVLLGRSRL